MTNHLLFLCTITTTTALIYSINASFFVIFAAAAYWLYRTWRLNRPPSKWRRIGIVDRINIYPLKSAAPLELNSEDEVTCDLLGLRFNAAHDRSLMLVGDQNQMISGRQYPKLVLVHPKMLSPTRVVFTAPNMEDLELDYSHLLEQSQGRGVYTSIFGAKIKALLCGERYDKWFSKLLLGQESGMRLAYYPYRKPVRAINMRMIHQPLVTCDDTGTFNNATSYMLINLASVKDLNTRLPHPTHPKQFRGSFQLRMDEEVAYAEDNWKWLKIGEDTTFRVLAPCTRCIFPTTNIFTGERDPYGEPLKTLNKYRLWPHQTGPSLGIQMGLRQTGLVKAGEVIYIDDE